MLGRVGLSALADRYPNELSGGEQQRVALARALIADTGLILCDEPLSNLDADLRERMRVEISSLVREAAATTVYITHDQAEAFALADQVGVLEKGRLVQSGTPEQIYTRPATPFVARFTGLAGEMTVRVRERHPDGMLLVEPVLGGGAIDEFSAGLPEPPRRQLPRPRASRGTARRDGAADGPPDRGAAEPGRFGRASPGGPRHGRRLPRARLRARDRPGRQHAPDRCLRGVPGPAGGGRRAADGPGRAATCTPPSRQILKTICPNERW